MNEEMIGQVASQLCSRKRIDITFGVEGNLTNPNGDPDRDNRPRTLPCGRGMITKGCINNKIRVALEKIYDEKIFTLRHQVRKNGIDELVEAKGGVPKDILKALLEEYIDLRFFGSTFTYTRSTKREKEIAKNLRSQRGPLQVDDMVSLEPLKVITTSITSQQVSNESQEGNGTFGTRHMVEHAMYQGTISFNPLEQYATLVSKEDFRKLLTALAFFGQVDASSGRRLETRYICVAQHTRGLGNATFSKVTGKSVLDIKRDEGGDYSFSLKEDLPKGVHFHLLA